MSRRLKIRIPGSASSRFLVTSEHPPPTVAALRTALTRTPPDHEHRHRHPPAEGRPGLDTRTLDTPTPATRPSDAHARTAAGLLGSPLLTLDARSTPTPWSARLRTIAGLEPGDLDEITRASHHVVLTGLSAPANWPLHPQSTRFAARTLASLTGGRVIDMDAGHLLPRGHEPPPRPGRFVLGEHWVQIYITPGAGPHLRADTYGLHRFGLPELAVRGLSYGTMHTGAAVLRSLAQALFTEQCERGAEDGPGEWFLSDARDLAGDDVLRFWGMEPAGLGGVAVHLAWTRPTCPVCVSCAGALEVCSPLGHALAAWWSKVERALPVVRPPTFP
ncbi:hypothetical protein [Actinomadura parmotrematis]|uniref:Uncharacterized protein n=1 Tax=Actinomadura parmotrematis TaxID=2864039 RepID=A0ABS7G4F7_9ACTN|nr:hypothetical protein [Actinomadura parmotrematis]MBW8487110.1 hypothetical protein [Actinomadura parmotrematis]